MSMVVGVISAFHQVRGSGGPGRDSERKALVSTASHPKCGVAERGRNAFLREWIGLSILNLARGPSEEKLIVGQRALRRYQGVMKLKERLDAGHV